MAITRMGHIKDDGKGAAAVTRVIKYITNPGKTEGGKLVGAHNIILSGDDVAGTAARQIMNTKQCNDKTEGRLELVDEAEATHIGCEYGEYSSPEDRA